MKHVAATTVTSVLCALWLGACASTAQEVQKSPAAQNDQTATQDPATNDDSMPLAKDLPATLDGEIRRAQALRSKGDLDDASRSLAQLMLIDPDDARVVGEYGKTLTQQGRARDAVAFLQRAVQLQPSDWTLHSALGVAYDQADDHTQARHEYTQALTISPGQPSVLNNMAVSYMLTKDWAGAQRYLAQAATKGSEHKIASNEAMLANLDTQDSPLASRPLPAAQAAPAHATTMAATHPAAASGQPVVLSPAAAPGHPTTLAATNPAPSATLANPLTRQAIAPPRPLDPIVVMQTVPKDPQAGPVKPKSVRPERVASKAKTPDRVAHLSAPPALRTAAEAN